MSDFFPLKKRNRIGQRELLDVIKRMMSPGGDWAGIPIRNVIPRTSFWPFLKTKSEMKGKGLGDRFHPPPGRKIGVLHLY